jgi:CHAT domain-containing protein/Tfp pilus assembly protein PilF
MRTLVYILFITFCSLLGRTQDIKETDAKFWEAIEKHDTEIIYKNGRKLIEFIESNNINLDTNIVVIYHNFSTASIELKYYDEALDALLNISEKIKLQWGEEHEYYSVQIGWLASVYGKIGDYQSELKYTLDRIRIMELTLGSFHEDYRIGLANLTICYSDIGDFKSALKYGLRLKTIDSLVVGENHLEYSSTLNTLSTIYAKLGIYNKAIEYSVLSLNIKEKVLPKTHEDIALNLNNLGYIYQQLGEYEKSLNYHLKALDIREKSIGRNSELYAASLNNIAIVYADKGDYLRSIQIQTESLAIKERILGKNHPLYASSLKNLAYVYSKAGNFKKALKIYQEVLKIEKKALGKKHPSYATTLNNVGIILYKMDKLNKSRKFLNKAINLRKSIFDKYHPAFRESLINIVLMHISLGDFQNATELALSASKLALEYFHLNFSGLTIQDQIILKNELESTFNLLTNLLLLNDSLYSEMFNQWINLNGVVSANIQNLENEILKSNDSSSTLLLEKLKLKKVQLLNYQELTIREKEKIGINSKVIEYEINSIERELSKKSKDFADFNRFLSATDVVKNLNTNEVFIDISHIPYYSFQSNKWTDSTQYLVFITDSKDTLVDYVFIEDGTKIDQDLFDQYKQEATDRERKTDLKSEKFYNYFWNPISDKIGDAKTVYVSLGGVYNNINLNTIYNPTTGKYLVEEKDIRIVNSARDFVLSKEREKKNYTTNTASLFGFPNFDGNTTVSADTSDLFASTRDLNSFWLDSLTRGGMKAKPLPATKTEVENISSTLKSKGWKVNSFLADNASETNIKKQQSPRILHVATHGYFFQDIPIENDNNRFLGMDRQQVVQDPMLRSMLLFTGANKTLKGETSSGENGLLSAAEASLLDLRETELVVLSACETGKGEVKNSEGVYGLRKAFSDAGAQNIIMSLWKVDDKVTQEFMSRFYEIWLNDKTTIREAFNKTQLEIKAKYPQPYYWGAFILVGE